MSKIDLNIGEDQLLLLRLAGQLKSIQFQLDNIRVQLLKLSGVTPPATLGELRGILAGQSETTEEEIDAALYRIPKEDDEPTSTAG